jgi:predicted SAM-dependent methyltransferase
MKLHLGCGNKHIEGYLNVDIRKLDSVDFVCDIKKLTEFEPNSIDVIYVSHVLEHIGRIEYKNVLSRWFELLKPNGILRIAVPDFEKVVEHYIEFKNLNQLRGFLYGGQNYPENYHLSIPNIFQAYLNIGAKVCSLPAIDKQFKTIDFLIIANIGDFARWHYSHYKN